MARTAREYLRVSQDRSGRLQSPEEQHADNARGAAAGGWRLGKPCEEQDGISASRLSTKRRPGYDVLIGDLRAGRFGADMLVLWESSRGSCRVGEWAELIDLCEKVGVKIHVTSHGRTYDPANWRDRRTLLEDAVDSEADTGKASVRIRRTAASTAAQGLPHGRIPYGYTRTWTTNARGKKEFASQDEHPE